MCQKGAGATCDGTCLKLSAADMVWWSNVFKTLGDPVRLQLLMQLAERAGAEAAMLSGSGPAVFGLFDSELAARAAAKSLEGVAQWAWWGSTAV